MSYWIKAYDIVENHIPQWVVFKSFFALLLGILLLLTVLLFLPFQDKVSGSVEIFSSGRPIELLTSDAGRLYLHADDGDFINKGDILATVQYNNEPANIRKIQTFVFNDLQNIGVENISAISDLVTHLISEDGHPLNASLIALSDAINQYRRSVQMNQPEREIAAIRQLQSSYSNQLPELEKTAALYNKSIGLSRNQLQQDSLLLIQGGISRRVYEQRRITLINDLREQLQVVSEQKKIEALIADQEAAIAALEDEFAQNTDLLFSKIQVQVENVRSAFNTTLQDQIIVSPSAGQFLLNPQTVPLNDVTKSYILGSITVSDVDQNDIVIAKFARNNTGKIEVGMSANIYLHDYPAKEYGMVRATVEAINNIPTSEVVELYLEVDIPIKTSYNQYLPLQKKYAGTIEVVIDRINLLNILSRELKFGKDKILVDQVENASR